MASQIVINGSVINLEDDIQFSFNAGQIANLSLSMSNYTEAFQIPRLSQTVVKIFEALGIPSDTSTLPYNINNVDVLSDYNYIYTGSMICIKTDDLYYYVTVISGTRDIFQLLGDKTFADIPIIRMSLPFKTADTVAAMAIYDGAFTDTIFAVANYGGITHFVQSGDKYVNVDCMPLLYHIQYLWNRIFELIGVANDTSDIPVTKFQNQYFSFPYPPLNSIGAFGTQVFSTTVSEQYQNLPASNQPAINSAYTGSFGSEFTQSGMNITCTGGGLYNFTFDKFYAYGQGNVNGQNILFPMTVILRKNGNEFFRFEASMNDTSSDTFFVNAVQDFQFGDDFTVHVVRYVTIDSGAFWNYYQFNSPLKITRVAINDEAAKEILNFKLADYVKEFMYRFALIGFKRGNFIEFKQIGNVLNSANSVDWSDKYVRRIEETYDIGFNQNNLIKHKYVTEGANYYDANIQSNNLNLPIEKPLITSNVYVPSQNTAAFSLGGSTSSSNDVLVKGIQTYTIDNTNNLKTEQRNFWVQVRPWPATAYFGSYTLKDTVNFTDQIIISDAFSGGFNTDNWSPLNQVTNDTRYHIFELNLSQTDIMQLDQTVAYFFRQESAYYMLNELSYKKGQLSIAKCTKINNR
jgi:hypothetical protein